MPKNDRSLQAKETALLALAQGGPGLSAFLDRYRQALPQVAALPAELVEELMAVEEDPALGELAKSYEEKRPGRPNLRPSGGPGNDSPLCRAVSPGRPHQNPPDPGGQVGIPAGAPQHAGRPPGKKSPRCWHPCSGNRPPHPRAGKRRACRPGIFPNGDCKILAGCVRIIKQPKRERSRSRYEDSGVGGKLFLETIYMLHQRKGAVRSIDIVNELSFSKPSVSVAMKKSAGKRLCGDGFRWFHHPVPQGSGDCRADVRAPRFPLRLADGAGVDPGVAVEDACRMEHVISAESFSAIKDYVCQKKRPEPQGGGEPGNREL